jgi:DNA-binding IclR family transcriptional regulator
VGCTKNKAFRLLATLELCGVVEKDLQNKYTIGFPAFQAARKIMSKKSLNDRVRPLLSEISGQINESTYLAHIGAEGLLLVDYADCRRPIKVACLVGKEVKLAVNSAISKEVRSLRYIGDIMVTTGVFDPEVTAVIAPFDDYTSSNGSALVVIAPSCRMPLSRIKTEIVPTLRAVMQFHSLLKLNEQNSANPLLIEELRMSSF